MKTKIILLTVGLMIAFNLLAQNPGQQYTDRMNYIFQYVDKSKITTGLLSDYGLQMVEPYVFNGIPADSNFVSMDTWKMLYSGIFTSKMNNNVTITSPETVFTQIDNSTHATAVPLAMMHYQYNQLNENAVNLNLLQVVNDQIREISGAASPYLTKQLFAVAPKELYFDGPTARFVFKSGFFYTNVSKTIQKREINFNNESGYLLANLDTQVSYTFNSGGVKTIYFRLTYTDGSSYTSKTNIHVTATTVQLRASQAGIDSIIIAANSQHSGGKIQIKYSSSNSSRKIKKPLIVAEGFDPFDEIDIKRFLGNDSIAYSSGTLDVNYYEGYSIKNLKNNIDYSQFDIIYLDYNKSMDDIWRNAALFQQVIDSVNIKKQGNEPNIVMGISMGGLVARIALRQMEKTTGKNHQTWKYISVDTPHKGANVPVGLQAALRHLSNTNVQVLFFNVFNYKNIAQLKFAVDMLNSTAAKQMLIYYVNNNYVFDNSVHNTFQQQYDQLGFPQQCENVAISNGNPNGGDSALTFPPGSTIIDYKFSNFWIDFISNVGYMFFGAFSITNYPQLALNVIPGDSQVRGELTVNALSNQTNSRIYKGKVYLKKKLLWLISVDIVLTDLPVNASGLPLDGAPGGLYSMDAMGLSIDFLEKSIKQRSFCFIPTVSALALSDWNTKLTQNVSAVSTPFSNKFTPNSNEIHTRFNSSASFLYNQLLYSSAPIGNPSLSGPECACETNSSTFTLSNVSVGSTVS